MVWRSRLGPVGPGPGTCRVGRLSFRLLTKNPDFPVNLLKEIGQDKVTLPSRGQNRGFLAILGCVPGKPRGLLQKCNADQHGFRNVFAGEPSIAHHLLKEH